MTAVLMIGYARGALDTHSSEHARLASCARTVDALHLIVFSHRRDGRVRVHEGSFFVHPTRSRSRILMLFDAYRIGSAVLSSSLVPRSDWVLLTQDPFEAGVVGFLLRLRFGITLQVQEHGDFFGGSWWRTERILNRVRYVFGVWLVRHADCVRVVSARVKQHLVLHGVDPTHITMLPVASETAAFQSRTPIKEAHNLRSQYPHAEVIILAVGRLVKEKHISLLIHSFRDVVRVHKMAQLVIIGSGAEEHSLKHLVDALGVSTQVLFIPWTDDVASYMRSADIFVLCSYREGWGRVIIEAMLAGLPAVVTDVGCVGEVFHDGEHGRVVPVDDPIALTQALEELITDPVKRRECAVRAAHDSARFIAQQPSYADAWRETITSCVGGKKRL